MIKHIGFIEIIVIIIAMYGTQAVVGTSCIDLFIRFLAGCGVAALAINVLNIGRGLRSLFK